MEHGLGFANFLAQIDEVGMVVCQIAVKIAQAVGLRERLAAQTHMLIGSYDGPIR